MRRNRRKETAFEIWAMPVILGIILLLMPLLGRSGNGQGQGFPDPVFQPTLQYFLENQGRFEAGILIELSGYAYPDGVDGIKNIYHLYPESDPSLRDQGYAVILVPNDMALGCGRLYTVQGRLKKSGKKFFIDVEKIKEGGNSNVQ